MMTKTLRYYLIAPLTLNIDALKCYQLLRAAFVVAFLSTVLIHLFLPLDGHIRGMLGHAIRIGLTYAISVALVVGALRFVLRTGKKHLHVWQIWALSFAGFVLGYYFVPLDSFIVWSFDANNTDHSDTIHFLKLLPVWIVVTYIFVQNYLIRSRKIGKKSLTTVDTLLDERTQVDANEILPIRFESGQKRFELDANSIRNITVEDHYCYIYYLDYDKFSKCDVGLPLRDIRVLLPDDFVQVHRSHIINLAHILEIAQRDRDLKVILNGGYEVPVSRHRLDKVLPLLRRRVYDSTP